MRFAIGHQTETDSCLDNYEVSKKCGDPGMLYQLRKRLGSQKRDHSDFFVWFSTLETHPAESEALRNQTKTYSAFVNSVSLLTESRDPYTAGHQKKVSEIAGRIAQEMGLPGDMIEGIRVAGMVHDMGKMSVPPEIVNKPAALTPFEFSIIKEHSQKAYGILKGVEFPWPIPEIVFQHHERLDGSGYPRRLKGSEIRLEARVLAVADVMEAISSRRPYRSGLGIEVALKEIDKNKGVLYDTEVARACQRSLKGTSAIMADQ